MLGSKRWVATFFFLGLATLDIAGAEVSQGNGVGLHDSGVSWVSHAGSESRNVEAASQTTSLEASPQLSALGERKDPLSGAVASLFVPGLGQVYGGDTGKGLTFFVAETMMSVGLSLVASRITEVTVEQRYSYTQTGPFPPGERRQSGGAGLPVAAFQSGFQDGRITYSVPVTKTNVPMRNAAIALGVMLAVTHVYNIVDGYNTVEQWNNTHGLTTFNIEIDKQRVAMRVARRF